MKVEIKTIGDTPLPEYETSGAVGFDLSAREDMIVPAKELTYIPTGVIIKVPEGYMLHVGARSSTPKKKGLMIPHGIGIIDQDYCGDEDEILLQYYNFTDEPVEIKKGERVGQGVFVKIEKATFEKVEKMRDGSRGGFGSTGS